MEGVTGGCKDIAYQLVKENQHIQVLFGGGRYYFLPNTTNDPKHGDKNVKKQRRDGLDLTKEWQNDKNERNLRSSYVWTRQQLMDIDPQKTDYALGLFNDGHLSFELDKDSDSTEEPSLAEMTEKAIRILRKNPKGFFLLVEGARIDSAHHDNNAKRALYETLAFETAIRGALELVDASNTLMLVTADHSHSFLRKQGLHPSRRLAAVFQCTRRTGCGSVCTWSDVPFTNRRARAALHQLRHDVRGMCWTAQTQVHGRIQTN